MWCGLTSRDEMPGVSDYGPQTPAVQVWPGFPHGVPLAALLGPPSTQTGAPVEQEIVPRSQTFVGVQVAPAVQAAQVPAPSQT
jgi:hypothetical protein